MGSRAQSTTDTLLESPEKDMAFERKRKFTSKEDSGEVDDDTKTKSKKLSILNPQDLSFQAACGERQIYRQQSTSFPGSTFFPVPLSPRLSPRSSDDLNNLITPIKGTVSRNFNSSPVAFAEFHSSDPVDYQPVICGEFSKLHSLIQNGEENQLENFLKDNPMLDSGDELGFTPLILAVGLPDKITGLSFLKSLMEAGADVRIGDLDGFTPLHWAAALNRSDAVEFLVASGAPIHLIAKNGDTPLHSAAKYGSMDALTVLLCNFKANPHIRNKAGFTVLEVAGHSGFPSVNKHIEKKIRKSLYDVDPTLRTLVLYHADCSEHCSESVHQEAPERIEAIMKEIKDSEFLKGCIHISDNFPPASRDVLLRVHDEVYIDMVLSLHEKVRSSGSPVPFTPRVQAMHGDGKLKDEHGCDTFFSAGSFPAAIRAAGAVCNAVDRVVQGFARNAFCCVRPPGHHAGVQGLLKNAVSCGFCIFNNVAIGAMHALTEYESRIKKVAIVDFDVHHGNGTEEIVTKKIKRPENLLFFSVHLYDKADGADIGSGEFYPGSGKCDCKETNVFNSPLVPAWRYNSTRSTRVSGRKISTDSIQKEASKGRIAFRETILTKLIPSLEQFKPDLLFVSAGFDAAKNDIGCGKTDNGKYISGIDLKAEDYRWATVQLQQIAQKFSSGRIISVLEGGYGQWATAKAEGGTKKFVLNRSNLGKNACAHVEGMVE